MKKYLCTLLLLPTLLFALPISTARADDAIVGDEEPDGRTASVTLAWDANSEEVAGYNLYYGRTSGDYLRVVSVTVPRATVTIKGSRTIYFAVTAYDENGLESDFSNEVSYP